MERFVNRFWRDEDGNVAIDWIILTAGVVMLGAAVMAVVGANTPSLLSDDATHIEQPSRQAGDN